MALCIMMEARFLRGLEKKICSGVNWHYELGLHVARDVVLVARCGTHSDEEGDVGGCYGGQTMGTCCVALVCFVVGSWRRDSR
ncbi:hypothetical protein LR48_Vigan03g054200 [Vigna angularis]|uniref:Uncharacterized protein n=1 Tax=Phaseolus angularis TaxID=3914 RepID=A0A0L9U314_PHAAN|nr:hypothetical protein LR48_Vigan03g054200 [Vigna angularis]